VTAPPYNAESGLDLNQAKGQRDQAVDFHRSDLRSHIEPIARRLLGTPNEELSTRGQLRFGTNGSVAVDIAGPKQGAWFDFEPPQKVADRGSCSGKKAGLLTARPSGG
jgi:hypothetical protein